MTFIEEQEFQRKNGGGIKFDVVTGGSDVRSFHLNELPSR